MAHRCSRGILVAGLLLVGSALVPVQGQALDFGDWSFDPAVLAGGQDLVRRTPDREVDAFFQAVHAAVRIPAQSQALCDLLAPDADRSLTGIQAALSRFTPDSGSQLAQALAGMLVAGSQAPPQRHDAAAGRQALKAAGVAAALLNDGFVAGLNADTGDVAGRQAQCRSLRWLLDAASARPLPERAAMTRLLLDEGLQRWPTGG